MILVERRKGSENSRVSEVMGPNLNVRSNYSMILGDMIEQLIEEAIIHYKILLFND